MLVVAGGLPLTIGGGAFEVGCCCWEVEEDEEEEDEDDDGCFCWKGCGRCSEDVVVFCWTTGRPC